MLACGERPCARAATLLTKSWIAMNLLQQSTARMARRSCAGSCNFLVCCGNPECCHNAAPMCSALCTRCGEMWPRYVSETAQPAWHMFGMLVATHVHIPVHHYPDATTTHTEIAITHPRCRSAQWKLSSCCCRRSALNTARAGRLR
jgi:hypothetical protein